MNSDRLKKYIWIVDTISSYGAITRARLSELWQKSALGDGNPLPHRSFFSARRAIEEQFGITIKVNGANEYYIDASDTVQDEAFRNWVLDAYAVNSMIDANRDLAPHIHIEPIPSARQHLPSILNAIRGRHTIAFTYNPFNRARAEQDIRLAPYFVKLFSQRWYVIGLRLKDNKIRTYALDRISALIITDNDYTIPPGIDASTYFADIFGITDSQAPPRQIKLRVDPYYAKFLRALPLHESQKEEQFSDFSIFNYRMKLTPDLVRHLLSLGGQVKVIEPPELRLMVIDALKETLKNYEN